MKVTAQENSQVDIQISRDMRVHISEDLASKLTCHYYLAYFANGLRLGSLPLWP